jgi:hypothetical protein
VHCNRRNTPQAAPADIADIAAIVDYYAMFRIHYDD